MQLGQNQNLFDFTENTNVAHAHYLAAVALSKHHPRQIPDSERVDGEAFFHHKRRAPLLLGLHSVCVAVRRGHHASRTSVDRQTARGACVSVDAGVGVLGIAAGRSAADEDESSTLFHDEIFLCRQG